MIAAAFISDRQDLYLPACRRSVAEHVHGIDGPTMVIDDRDHRLGLAGAVRAAWEWALDVGCDFLWHQEEDFVITDDIDLPTLAAILDRDWRLAQLVLKRQPWSPAETDAGGIIEMDPAGYSEAETTDGPVSYDGIRTRYGPGTTREVWTVHQRIFSLNPCLVPRRVLEFGWPDGNEAVFTQRCVAAGYSFAFYGAKSDPPRCQHVGAVRSTGWRL